MSEQSAPKTNREGIALIIMVGIVSVVCILACAGIALAFILNAPW